MTKLSKKNKWIGLVIIIILGVVLFFVFRDEDGGFKNPVSIIKEDGSKNDNSLNEEFIPVPEVAETEIEKIDESKNSFFHPQYKFSLNYPSDMNSTNFTEGGGEQILFQDSSNDRWFQMYITPWDEGDNLSVDRIRQDLPDLLIQSPQTVILGPKQADGVGPRAVIFFGEQDGLGETREVWFVRGDFLYQITTFKRLDSFLAEILSTLQFN